MINLFEKALTLTTKQETTTTQSNGDARTDKYISLSEERDPVPATSGNVNVGIGPSGGEVYLNGLTLNLDLFKPGVKYRLQLVEIEEPEQE